MSETSHKTEGHTILKFRAENIKRLKVVTIEPKGSVVEITGSNNQGKSSTIDALWWLFTGARNAQSVPIREGEDEATIFADMGNLKVTRTFRRKDGEKTTYPTSLVIENADGAHYPTPQKMLDAMVGTLAMDPLEFTRLKPHEKFDVLRAFVKDFDFDEAERLDKKDFDARTEVNRQARSLRAQAEAIKVPDDLPEERVDEQALVDQLSEVGAIVADIENRKTTAYGFLRQKAEMVERIERLKRSTKEAKVQIMELRSDIARFAKTEAECQQSMEVMQAEFDALPPLPEMPDTRAIKDAIATARITNALMDARDRRRRLLDDAKAAETLSMVGTNAMEYRAALKRDAIASAALPVPGIGFGDKAILLDGLPFEQASSSQQLRTSIAIAMARNPALRVMRIAEGALLDDASFEIVREMAAEAGWQVWIETVSSNRDTAIVIEDGRVKKRPSKD